MKKKFILMLLIVPTVCISSIYAAEEQVSKKQEHEETEKNIIEHVLKTFGDPQNITFNLNGNRAIARYKDGKKISIYLNAAGTRAAIVDNNGRGQIINLKNKKVLFENDKITRMDPNPTDTKIAVSYTDMRVQNINFNNGKELLKKSHL